MLKKLISSLMVMVMIGASILPVMAEPSNPLRPKQTYYEVEWDGDNENIISTQDQVYIDAYYAFDVSKYVTSDYTAKDIASDISGEAEIAADSYFVSWGNYTNSLNVVGDVELSTKNTLYVKVSTANTRRAALRYLGNGADYAITGYAEFGDEDNIVNLSLDEKFAIEQTNTITDIKDFPKDVYVTGYTLSSDTIDKNSTFNIGVNVVDPNFTYESMNGKSFDKSFAIMTGNSFGSQNLQGYINDVRPDGMGYLMYTVWFEDVRYLNDGPLEFNVSYAFNYSENGKSYRADQSKKVSSTIYELNGNGGSNSDFTPNVIISNYTGQNGMVAGVNSEIKADFKNTNNSIDVHNVVITVRTGDAFTQTKGVNKFFVDTIKAGESATITLNIASKKTVEPASYPIDFDIEYEYISGGKTNSMKTSGQISIPVAQTDRLNISYVKMNNVYQNSESEVSYSIINGGMSTLLNTNLEIVNANGEVLGSMYLGRLEPGKEAKGTNIYITFPEAGEQALTARITYEDVNFNSKTVEEPFTVNVMAMGGGWIEPPMVFPEEPVVEEPSKNNGMLWVGLAVVAVACAGGFVFYKKKKTKA